MDFSDIEFLISKLWTHFSVWQGRKKNILSFYQTLGLISKISTLLKHIQSDINLRIMFLRSDTLTNISKYFLYKIWNIRFSLIKQYWKLRAELTIHGVEIRWAAPNQWYITSMWLHSSVNYFDSINLLQSIQILLINSTDKDTDCSFLNRMRKSYTKKFRINFPLQCVCFLNHL